MPLLYLFLDSIRYSNVVIVRIVVANPTLCLTYLLGRWLLRYPPLCVLLRWWSL